MKEKDPRGRKCKLTEDNIINMAEHVQRGLTPHIAAKLHGISPSTYRRYIRNGNKYPDGLYGVFRTLVLHAEAMFEAAGTKAIYEAGLVDGGIDHLKWLLERRFPLRLGKNVGEFSRMRKNIRELEKEVDRLVLQATTATD